MSTGATSSSKRPSRRRAERGLRRGSGLGKKPKRSVLFINEFRLPQGCPITAVISLRCLRPCSAAVGTSIRLSCVAIVAQHCLASAADGVGCRRNKPPAPRALVRRRGRHPDADVARRSAPRQCDLQHSEGVGDHERMGEKQLRPGTRERSGLPTHAHTSNRSSPSGARPGETSTLI